LAESVSATMVTATEPLAVQLPPGQGFAVCGPLQAVKEKDASKRVRSRDPFRFIGHPTPD
jgi:hypothetical protein